MKWLKCIMTAIGKPKRKVIARLIIGPVYWQDNPNIGEETIMSFVITIDQQFDAAVAFVDSAGNPAVVDGVPVWASSDDAVLAVQAADDGMSATAAAVSVGTAQLSVTADADLGGGVRQVIGLLEVNIVGGEAVAAVITPSTPVDKLTVQPVSP